MVTARRIPGMERLAPMAARLRRPDGQEIGAAATLGFAGIVLAVATSPALRGHLGWVPVEHDNSVVDAFLAVSLATVFLVVAAVVVLPIALAIHQAGHALGGRLIGMRLLAVRVGPILVEPGSATGVVTRLPLRGRDDLVVAWSHLDDTPLPAWKRPRGWIVMLAAGSAANLAVSFVCAMGSIVAAPVGYVLLREMVWINLAVCVAALIPVTVAGIESDGRRLYDLLMNGDAADALTDRLRDEVVVGPTRPAAWPRERLAAWEAKIRRMPASAQGRDEQLELAVYLMLHNLDRGDRDGAWQWSQTLQALIGVPCEGESVAADIASVVLAIHAARWDGQLDTARRHLDRVGDASPILRNPWRTVASAAVALGEATGDGTDREGRLRAARAQAADAVDRLTVPAKLHGVDQLMRGLGQAVAGDADVELARLAYAAGGGRDERARAA